MLGGGGGGSSWQKCTPVSVCFSSLFTCLCVDPVLACLFCEKRGSDIKLIPPLANHLSKCLFKLATWEHITHTTLSIHNCVHVCLTYRKHVHYTKGHESDCSDVASIYIYRCKMHTSPNHCACLCINGNNVPMNLWCASCMYWPRNSGSCQPFWKYAGIVAYSSPI